MIPAYIHYRKMVRFLHGPARILVMLSRPAVETTPLATWAAKCLRAIVARVATLLESELVAFMKFRFRRELVENTDFRKYDDGLRMTLDCSAELADAIDVRSEGLNGEVHRLFWHASAVGRRSHVLCAIPHPGQSRPLRGRRFWRLRLCCPQPEAKYCRLRPRDPALGSGVEPFYGIRPG